MTARLIIGSLFGVDGDYAVISSKTDFSRFDSAVERIVSLGMMVLLGSPEYGRVATVVVSSRGDWESIKEVCGNV